jgi:hypothetical protein
LNYGYGISPQPQFFAQTTEEQIATSYRIEAKPGKYPAR